MGSHISNPIAQLWSYTMSHYHANAMSQTWSYMRSHVTADAISQIWSYTGAHPLKCQNDDTLNIPKVQSAYVTTIL
ncbi:Shikimate dehydrogenase [Gossypium arboreum]|uniref:Shikimate dehydrogenase n=1 Tax=Gossypium arboreum TaxID=29729 RepID=A0A0B0Q0N8_GOSAR|nr:Shikimate dehydrogenase [Gossypium arboreum]